MKYFLALAVIGALALIVFWYGSGEEKGIVFNFPASLPTKYIQALDWPPQVRELSEPYSCIQAGAVEGRAGKTEERIIAGRNFCVTEVVGAAAGSRYTQYAYITKMGRGSVALTFSIRSPECANYEDPQRSECEAERQGFRADELIGNAIN